MNATLVISVPEVEQLLDLVIFLGRSKDHVVADTGGVRDPSQRARYGLRSVLQEWGG